MTATPPTPSPTAPMGGPLALADASAALAWLRQRLGASGGTLQSDSRRVRPGDAFIAWPGAATDGRAHVGAALAAGALACLVEADGIDAFAFSDDAPIAQLAGLKAATGAIAHAWFDQPGTRLAVVASTGTNGKTSTAWWVAQALSLAGQRCGVIGTLGVGEPPSRAAPDASVKSTGLTTPDPLTLHRALAAFADQGFAACAIEASSIGLAEQRLAALPIRVALFTNFTPDHLDYHADMASYWSAKRVLFDWPGLRAAVINRDDPKGAELATDLAERGALDLWTYALNAPARLRASGLHYVDGGLAFTLHEGAQQQPVRTGLIGDYNAANALAVIGAMRALDVPLAQAAALAIDFTPVPGRMQRVQHGGASTVQPQVVVDYAHTPDALDKALSALRPLARAQGSQLWCVFGCGGNRDASKRPLMGAIAARLADAVCVTSDNPRLEDPQAIVDQILAGIPPELAHRVSLQIDRAAAIAEVLAQAARNDVVLIAGKGHEDHQDAGGVKRPFSDADEALKALRLRQHVGALTLARAHELIAPSIPAARLIDPQGLAATTLLNRVHTDTRTLRAGDLFVALRGERFDANDFLGQAQAAGATAAIAERGVAAAGLPGMEVPDSLVALQALARGWRAVHHLPVIAITGSNGKTTVTQMVAAILRAWLGDAAHATAGNLNNHIGVPLTVLGLRGDATLTHRAAVIELGMNHPGEIAELAAIAQPTVALVNNAQREHQEFMQSVDAVARENGSVITALPAHRVAVFPADDAHSPLWRSLAGARQTLTFALDVDGGTAAGVEADCVGHASWAGDHWVAHFRTPAGPIQLTLAVAGLHNVKNALAACACALAAGCPLEAVQRGLNSFRAVKGRSQASVLDWAGRRVTLIDDSYNANPDSVRAAIEVLAALPAPRWLLLGDMGEVGQDGPAFHAEVGALAAERGIEHLWTAGVLAVDAARAFDLSNQRIHGIDGDAPLAQGVSLPAAATSPALHHADSAALVAAIARGESPVATSVLVKGSRFMRMETAVAALRAQAAPSSGEQHHAG